MTYIPFIQRFLYVGIIGID